MDKTNSIFLNNGNNVYLYTESYPKKLRNHTTLHQIHLRSQRPYDHWSTHQIRRGKWHQNKKRNCLNFPKGHWEAIKPIGDTTLMFKFPSNNATNSGLVQVKYVTAIIACELSTSPLKNWASGNLFLLHGPQDINYGRKWAYNLRITWASTTSIAPPRNDTETTTASL